VTTQVRFRRRQALIAPSAESVSALETELRYLAAIHHRSASNAFDDRRSQGTTITAAGRSRFAHLGRAVLDAGAIARFDSHEQAGRWRPIPGTATPVVLLIASRRVVGFQA